MQHNHGPGVGIGVGFADGRSHGDDNENKELPQRPTRSPSSLSSSSSLSSIARDDGASQGAWQREKLKQKLAKQAASRKALQQAAAQRKRIASKMTTPPITTMHYSSPTRQQQQQQQPMMVDRSRRPSQSSPPPSKPPPPRPTPVTPLSGLVSSSDIMTERQKDTGLQTGGWNSTNTEAAMTTTMTTTEVLEGMTQSRPRRAATPSKTAAPPPPIRRNSPSPAKRITAPETMTQASPPATTTTAAPTTPVATTIKTPRNVIAMITQSIKPTQTSPPPSAWRTRKATPKPGRTEMAPAPNSSAKEVLDISGQSIGPSPSSSSATTSNSAAKPSTTKSPKPVSPKLGGAEMAPTTRATSKDKPDRSNQSSVTPSPSSSSSNTNKAEKPPPAPRRPRIVPNLKTIFKGRSDKSNQTMATVSSSSSSSTAPVATRADTVTNTSGAVSSWRVKAPILKHNGAEKATKTPKTIFSKEKADIGSNQTSASSSPSISPINTKSTAVKPSSLSRSFTKTAAPLHGGAEIAQAPKTISKTDVSNQLPEAPSLSSPSTATNNGDVIKPPTSPTRTIETTNAEQSSAITTPVVEASSKERLDLPNGPPMASLLPPTNHRSPPPPSPPPPVDNFEIPTPKQSGARRAKSLQAVSKGVSDPTNRSIASSAAASEVSEVETPSIKSTETPTTQQSSVTEVAPAPNTIAKESHDAPIRPIAPSYPPSSSSTNNNHAVKSPPPPPPPPTTTNKQKPTPPKHNSAEKAPTPEIISEQRPSIVPNQQLVSSPSLPTTNNVAAVKPPSSTPTRSLRETSNDGSEKVARVPMGISNKRPDTPNPPVVVSQVPSEIGNHIPPTMRGKATIPTHIPTKMAPVPKTVSRGRRDASRSLITEATPLLGASEGTGKPPSMAATFATSMNRSHPTIGRTESHESLSLASSTSMLSVDAAFMSLTQTRPKTHNSHRVSPPLNRLSPLRHQYPQRRTQVPFQAKYKEGLSSQNIWVGGREVPSEDHPSSSVPWQHSKNSKDDGGERNSDPQSTPGQGILDQNTSRSKSQTEELLDAEQSKSPKGANPDQSTPLRPRIDRQSPMPKQRPAEQPQEVWAPKPTFPGRKTPVPRTAFEDKHLLAMIDSTDESELQSMESTDTESTLDENSPREALRPPSPPTPKPKAQRKKSGTIDPGIQSLNPPSRMIRMLHKSAPNFRVKNNRSGQFSSDSNILTYRRTDDDLDVEAQQAKSGRHRDIANEEHSFSTPDDGNHLDEKTPLITTERPRPTPRSSNRFRLSGAGAKLWESTRKQLDTIVLSSDELSQDTSEGYTNSIGAASTERKKSKEEAREDAKKQFLEQMKLSPVTAALAIVCYLVIGTVAYCTYFEPDWTPVDSAYFAMVTLTTVGYGDLTPSNDASRVFTCIFSLGGLSCLGIALGVLGSNLIEAQVQAMNHASSVSQMQVMTLFGDVGKKRDQRSSLMMTASAAMEVTKYGDMSEDELADEIETLDNAKTTENEKPPWQKSRFLMLLPLVAVLFFASYVISDGTDWGSDLPRALYFFVTTSATLGYGDAAPTTQRSRLLAILFIPVAVITMGELLSTGASFIIQKREAELRKKYQSRDLTIEDLEAMDADDDNEVTRAEYLQFMLLAMNQVDWDLLNDLNAQFDRLDTDGTGVLDKTDLILAAKKKLKSGRRKLELASYKRKLLSVGKSERQNGSLDESQIPSFGDVKQKLVRSNGR